MGAQANTAFSSLGGIWEQCNHTGLCPGWASKTCNCVSVGEGVPSPPPGVSAARLQPHSPGTHPEAGHTMGIIWEHCSGKPLRPHPLGGTLLPQVIIMRNNSHEMSRIVCENEVTKEHSVGAPLPIGVINPRGKLPPSMEIAAVQNAEIYFFC